MHKADEKLNFNQLVSDKPDWNPRSIVWDFNVLKYNFNVHDRFDY